LFELTINQNVDPGGVEEISLMKLMVLYVFIQQ